jgi:amino acid efflux transporter
MLWCFLGLEIVANLAEEFRNPERDIPWVVVGGVMLAGLVYYLCAATLLSAGFESVDSDALLQLASDRLGPVGLQLLSVFGFLACFASLNTYLNGFSRGLWSLADEGKLPSWLTHRSAKQVPTAALNLIAAVCFCATLLFYTDWLDLAELITLANAHFVLVYLAAMISAVILLEGLGRWIAALGTLCCVGGFIALGSAAVYGLVVLAALIFLAPTKAVSD